MSCWIQHGIVLRELKLVKWIWSREQWYYFRNRYFKWRWKCRIWKKIRTSCQMKKSEHFGREFTLTNLMILLKKTSMFLAKSHCPKYAPVRFISGNIFLLPDSGQTLDKILPETRKYADQFIWAAGDVPSPQSRARRWNSLDFRISHLKKFIGLSLLMGIVRIKDVKSYWSERFACLWTPYFKYIMSRKVFQ